MIKSGQPDHDAFELGIILVLGEMVFLRAQVCRGTFKSVALLTLLGRHALLAVTENDVELVGSNAVHLRSVFGTLRCVNATEPIGGRSQAVSVVLEQRMLSGQS